MQNPGLCINSLTGTGFCCQRIRCHDMIDIGIDLIVSNLEGIVQIVIVQPLHGCPDTGLEVLLSSAVDIPSLRLGLS